MSTAPITDSSWFWLALFTAVGLSALLATGGKFGKRQSGIERRYQARDRYGSAQGLSPQGQSPQGQSSHGQSSHRSNGAPFQGSDSLKEPFNETSGPRYPEYGSVVGLQREGEERDGEDLKVRGDRIGGPQEGARDLTAPPSYSTAKKTMVGLWPLASVLGVLCVTSLMMLFYTRRSERIAGP